MKLAFFQRISLFILLGLISTCKSNRVIDINHPLTHKLVSEMFLSDTCDTNSRAKVIDNFLEEPIIGLDSTVLLKWLKEPIHRRLKQNGGTIFVYTVFQNNEKLFCGYGDLFCIEFDKKGRLKSNYLLFITEEVDLTLFWNSKEIPPISKEGNNDSHFFTIF